MVNRSNLLLNEVLMHTLQGNPTVTRFLTEIIGSTITLDTDISSQIEKIIKYFDEHVDLTLEDILNYQF